jgi:hypothetical protein
MARPPTIWRMVALVRSMPKVEVVMPDRTRGSSGKKRRKAGRGRRLHVTAQQRPQVRAHNEGCEDAL